MSSCSKQKGCEKKEKGKDQEREATRLRRAGSCPGKKATGQVEITVAESMTIFRRFLSAAEKGGEN